MIYSRSSFRLMNVMYCIILIIPIYYFVYLRGHKSRLIRNQINERLMKSWPEEYQKLPSFDAFQIMYNRSYHNESEKAIARDVYERNCKLIEEHNNAENTFRVWINDMSDWDHNITGGEFTSPLMLKWSIAFMKLETIEIWNESQLFLHLEKKYSLPDAVDWRIAGDVVGPIGHQQHCGSCWTYAVTGILEGQQHKLYKNRSVPVVPLSKQQLIDCAEYNFGCHGGSRLIAMSYIRSVGGLQTERDYPYESNNSVVLYPCRANSSSKFHPSTTRKSKILLLEGKNEELLKNAVAFYGPVSVSIKAKDPVFAIYKTGIYMIPDCSNDRDELDHDVLVIGYGTTEEGLDYWIIKNSYGTEWGMDGYFYLARNQNNHCGVASLPVLVINEPEPYL